MINHTISNLITMITKFNKFNVHHFFTFLKNFDFVLLRHDLYLKFGFLLMKFEVFFLKLYYIKSKFWIAYFKFRSKALWAFQNRFPNGLTLRVWRYGIRIFVT